jgi:hypothetical protein
MNNKYRRGPYPSTLPASDKDDGPDIAPQQEQQRFTDTRELVEYGVKLGIGKATQDKALRQLQERFPEQAAMFDNPMFLAGMKMALPLIGIQLAQQLSSPALSNRILDASQGMLLVNTIDTTANVTGAVADQLVEMGSFLLGLYGIGGEEAAEGARQIAADLGIDSILSPTAAKSTTDTA